MKGALVGSNSLSLGVAFQAGPAPPLILAPFPGRLTSSLHRFACVLLYEICDCRGYAADTPPDQSDGYRALPHDSLSVSFETRRRATNGFLR